MLVKGVCYGFHPPHSNPDSVCVRMLSRFSHVQPFPALWTVAHQAPLSVGFSRQEYWSGLPFPSVGDLPEPGIEPKSSALTGRFFTAAPPRKPYTMYFQIADGVFSDLGIFATFNDDSWNL